MFTIKKSKKKNTGLYQSGVTVYNGIASTDAENNPLYADICKGLLVLALAFSTLIVFCTGAEIEVYFPLLFLYCALVTFISCSFNSKIGALSKPALIILLLLFIIFTPTVRYGFCEIINEYLEMIRMQEVFEIPEDYSFSTVIYLKTLALCEIATIIIPALSYACFYRTNIFIVFLCTFPFAEMVLYWGLEPQTLFFNILISGWICAFVMQIASMNFIRTKSQAHYRLKKNSGKFYLSSKKLASGIAGRTIPITASLCAVLFIGFYVYVSLFHTRPESLDRMRSGIKYAIENFSFDDFSGSMNNLALNFGLGNSGISSPGTPPRLGSQDGMEYTGEVVLKVEANHAINNNIYLRGYVGSVYEDNSWLQLDEDIFDDYTFLEGNYPIQGVDFINASSQPLSFTRTELSIENIGATKYAYAPYLANYLSIDGVRFYNDAYVVTNEENYTVSFYQPDSTMYLGRFIQSPYNIDSNNHGDLRQTNYQMFVRRYYLDYEREIIDSALDGIFNSSEGILQNYAVNFDDLYASIINEGYQISLMDAANAVGNYFYRNYTYNITPGRTPDGEDFVQYFLEQMDSASCTYFASAGTLIMRALGFPARYVEGFIITPDEFDGKNHVAEVSDRNAHAWCEVYIDDIGWVPLEFTPGFSDGTNPNIEYENQGNESVTTTTTTVTTDAPNQSSTTTPAATTTSSQEQSAVTTTVSSTVTDKEGNIVVSDEGKERNTVDYSKIIGRVVLVIIFVGSVFAVILCWRLIRQKIIGAYRKEISRPDRNKAVIAIYRRYLLLLKAEGIDIEKNVTDIDMADALADIFRQKGLENMLDDFGMLARTAVEADMSVNTILEENYKLCLDALKKLESFIRENCSKPRRFVLKYIYFYF